MTRLDEVGATLPESDAGRGEPGPVGDRPRLREPYIRDRKKSKFSMQDNSRMLFLAGGIAVALLLFLLGRAPHHPLPAAKATHGKQQGAGPIDSAPSAPESLLPILEAGRPQERESEGNLIHPDEIARTASNQVKPQSVMKLGDIRPFDDKESWNPVPYQPAKVPGSSGIVPAAEPREAKNVREGMGKASLIFVRAVPASPGMPRIRVEGDAIDLGLHLAPGTRLRARLESALNSAIETPVVAVIQYNYEQDGEIVVPAGARAYGRLERADRSGYVGVRFDSLVLSNGEAVSIQATATDLELRPLKGKVEGKHTGKNVLVRSLAGVGEVVATLAGRGGLNQPLSEGDLLRERLSSNLAQASDEQVARLVTTESPVVSVPAGTEILVVLQKSTLARPAGAPVPKPSLSQLPSARELRELLELQRELNQGANASHPER